MTTLTEFLLARIADDEAPTWELVPYECEPGCCAPAGWVGHRCLICRTVEFGGTVETITKLAQEHGEEIHRRSRVLAECEAKRRVIKWASHGRTTLDEAWDSENDHAAAIYMGDSILRAMAAVYADHPDYRQEWAA